MRRVFVLDAAFVPMSSAEMRFEMMVEETGNNEGTRFSSCETQTRRVCRPREILAGFGPRLYRLCTKSRGAPEARRSELFAQRLSPYSTQAAERFAAAETHPQHSVNVVAHKVSVILESCNENIIKDQLLCRLG